MTDDERTDESSAEERPYEAPALTILGRVSELTGGVGGSVSG